MNLIGSFLWVIQAFLTLTWGTESTYSSLNSPSESLPIEKPPLVLGQGEQRLLRIPGLHRYSLGSNSVRVLPLSKNFVKGITKGLENSPRSRQEGLLIKGVLPGVGDLWIWKQDGTSEHRTIRVEKLPREDRNFALEKSLSTLQEAEVILMGQRTVLRGEIQSLSECSKIVSLTEAFPQQIQDETELSSELLAKAEIQLNQWLAKIKPPSNLRLERIGQTLWIRGSVENPLVQKTFEKQIRTLFPMTKTEIDALPDHAPTIYFRVFLLELKRSQFHSLGLNWPSHSPNAFKVTSGGIQDLLQIDITLQQLEGSGNAKVLSNPELVVRAPGEAELFAGGEVPIQTQSQYYSNVTWKNYGLILRLKVTHTAGDKVRLDIFTEVSHLDAHIGQGTIPGIQANRMKTQVDAKFGTPLLLSGLLQQGIREEAKGLPFLRNIPVLGALFGSEDYLNERSELVALLYPHASPPPAPANLVHLVPKGPIPPPRTWLSPKEIRGAQESKDYPWNVLQ